MPLISGTVPSLINGISQQPATLRMPNQGQTQKNGFSHVSRGLQKRPCTEHVAKVVGVESANSNDVFIHTIRRSEDEVYALVIKGGTSASNNGNAEMKLYDLTGFATGTAGDEVYIHPTEQTGDVSTNGTIDVSYLSNFTASSGTNPFAPNKLGATTIADYTFLLNKTTKVKKKTNTTHPTRDFEALVHFKVGDYDSSYKIKVVEYNVDSDGEINKDSPRTTITATYKTPDNEVKSRTASGAGGAETETLNNAEAVIIKNIAESFFDGDLAHLTAGDLEEDPNDEDSIIRTPTTANCVGTGTLTGAINAATLNAATSGGSPWTVRYDSGESLLYISNDTRPFIVECTDGKGDSYMTAINGSDEVSNFGKLPGSKHPTTNGTDSDTGFVAKISGDKNSGQDDYYVKWNGSVWKECARPQYPGIDSKFFRKDLDPATMPIRLYKAFDASDNIYFILKEVPWEERTVGDDNINPFPSFCNYDEVDFPDGLFEINDIFFHRNRLGFVSDENVILSSAANYYQFFATTVLSVLDTGLIDVAVSNNQVAILKSAIPFQENLLLFSDLQQFKLTSDAFLTPTSVTVDVATNFETSTIAKPVPAGKTIFFPFLRGAYSGIREYFIEIASETNDANEVTSHVPELMAGTVAKLAVSSNEEVLCVLGNTDRKKLYIYKYYYADKEKLQSSWSVWEFDADIVDMSFIGSVAFFLFRRGSQIYLEKLNLSVDNATSIMDDKVEVRLDRRVRLQNGEDLMDELSDFYTDVQHDAVATTTISKLGTEYGTRIKIDASGGILNKPRPGQTFTSAHDATITYTIITCEEIDTSTSPDSIEITVTPSIAREAPIPDNTVLTFKEREAVYVVETGEVISSSTATGILAQGTDFSVSKGNTTPDIFVGIPYDFEYEFSEQFVKANESSINSGRLQMRNFEISYDKTGFFEVEVSPRPFDDRLRKIQNRKFTGKKIGSLFLGQQELQTGVFRVPVYCSSKDVKIKVKSDSWLPLAIQSADWEAFQVLRNQRI
tara:strand:+ start:1219 stop:4254 length:3036 start_codon:yes stop_codon:yes gene_type:complete